jgi:multidrug efflux system membrane fusion protein
MLILLVVIAALGYGAMQLYQKRQFAAFSHGVSSGASTTTGSGPVQVQLQRVEETGTPIYLTARGAVTPSMSVMVRASVSGVVQPIKLNPGERVKQGETILTIDPRPYQAALDKAKKSLADDEAKLASAQTDNAKYKTLVDSGTVTQKTLDANQAIVDQYRNAIDTDKQGIETAQLQLNWCKVPAPVDGLIGQRLVSAGSTVTANSSDVATIEQMQPIAVYFTLPGNQQSEVLRRLSERRILAVEAYDAGDSRKLASGQLLSADNDTSGAAGGKLKAVFDNPRGELEPGKPVNVHLVLETRSNALVVASSAIQTGLQGPYVWTVDDYTVGNATARIQLVKIAQVQGQNTIIESGLQAGDRVVVQGMEKLKPGQAVAFNALPPTPQPVRQGIM